MFKLIKDIHQTTWEVSKVLRETSIPIIISYPFYFFALLFSVLWNKLKKFINKNKFKGKR